MTFVTGEGGLIGDVLAVNIVAKDRTSQIPKRSIPTITVQTPITIVWCNTPPTTATQPHRIIVSHHRVL